MLRVTVWSEFFQEQTQDDVKAVYPNGINQAVADFLGCDDVAVTTAALLGADCQVNEDCGLPQQLIDNTDVLLWWAHCKHDLVTDEVAKRVQDAVLKGMGVIFLHSAHKSKPFMGLMGTSGNLLWREANEKEILWVTAPAHPIVQGVGPYIELEQEEMYGEHFDIPTPDELVLIGWFQGGNVFRSGCCFYRGHGRVFYFQPGHETHPTYHNPQIQTILKNAVQWAAPIHRIEELKCYNSQAVVPID